MWRRYAGSGSHLLYSLPPPTCLTYQTAPGVTRAHAPLFCPDKYDLGGLIHLPGSSNDANYPHHPIHEGGPYSPAYYGASMMT